MYAVLTLVSQIIEIYIWIIMASAVLSWLLAFGVINPKNRFVYMIGDGLHRLTEPAYRRIRRFIPSMGVLDLAPLILILGLMFLRNLLWETLGPMAAGAY